ncbi:nitric oxide-sensing protein NosP [Motiliproteus sediminis]|uniref:nitric oxide-sensing protein NosP n=1 Tax=Motiliproteus sediminis TaxID=1468178 RepID=UPI001AF0038C|nr:nitric oxide-sensing protein NosP [Motiliproteus sediminis]
MPLSLATESAPARTAVSNLSNPLQAAAELGQQLQSVSPSLVLFFCSTDYDLGLLSSALQTQFPDVPLVGCTTAGEITPLGYSRGSITAVAFSAEHFAIEVALFHNLAEFSFYDAQQLVHSMLDRCKERTVAPIKGHSFALALLDGLSVREEQLLNVLSANLGLIPLLGGSAGDDLHLRDTHVYCNGEFHSDAAVLLLINTCCDFEVFSIDHLEDSGDKLVVTEAVADERRVLELNANPAALEYASTLNLRVDQLDSLVFALNPLSVRIGDRFYPRAIQKVNEDLSLSFYCAVETGIVLTRSHPVNLVGGLKQLFDELRRRIGEPQLMIGYDCIFRRLEIEHSGIQEDVSALLRDNHVVGFNTYGEQFDGMHLNQTFTGVALGRSCLE